MTTRRTSHQSGQDPKQPKMPHGQRGIKGTTRAKTRLFPSTIIGFTGGGTSYISKYYNKVTPAEREHEVTPEIERLRQTPTNTTTHTFPTRKKKTGTPDRRHDQQDPNANSNPPTIQLQLLTQNVRGFAKDFTKTKAWFDGFRQQTSAQATDIIYLQETRAKGPWAAQLEARYARVWGYRPEQLTQPLSYWASTTDAAGGVAILLTPSSRLQDARPWWPTMWSEHFIAIQGTVDGEQVTCINIYGPNSAVKRAQLFTSIAQLPTPTGTRLMGGDFNCTMDAELDRSRTTTKKYDSAALHQLLVQWDLVDALTTEMLAASTPAQVADFQAAHHTFRYTLRRTTQASCRLDRWYIDRSNFNRLFGATVQLPARPSDHDAVILQLLPPDHQQQVTHRHRKRRRQLLYPRPLCATQAMDTATANHLNALTVDLARAAAEVTRVRWDKAKTTLRVQTLRARHAAVHTATRSRNQRVKRLREQLKAAKIQAVRPTRSGPATVDSVAEDLAMLDLDPTTRVERVRQALINVRYERAQRRRQTKFAQYEGTGPAATRAFYKRISMRFGSAPLARLAPDPTRTSNPADRLAEDWRVITQQAPPSQELQDRLFETLPAKQAVNDFRYLTNEFTAAEVEKAIRASPRGKASGPDGIPNDWYQENAADMAVIMAPVYTQWLRSGRVPTSFKHATIFCIPKVKQPATGLDYRPIALLNSDYKIFSRLLLNRLRPDLGKLVSNAQFGFVPDRQVHDAVDVWTRSKSQMEMPLPRQWHFYLTSPKPVQDGKYSKRIRQGCPLAPVLFVLALDVLYELIDANAGVTGVDLGAAKPTKIAGYADDTTLFLGSPSEEPAALETLRIFAEVSGLKVNVQKSVAVCLHPMGHIQELHEMVIPVAAATQHTRLLGVQVASDPSAAHVWDTTIQQLRARLHLTAIKTTSVIQRVAVARAVIMPKILYVARHEWPSPATVEKLQTFTNNYIWKGVLVADQRQGRAWMSRAVAQLPARDGGLSIPNLRLELQLLSAKTVERWHRPAAGLGTHVGRILTRPTRLHDPPENPITRHEPTHVHHRATPLDTGIDFLQQHMTQPRSVGEKECLAELQRQVRPGSWRTQWWSDGWLHRNYNEHRAALVAMQACQNSEHGTLDKWCLFATRATTDAILLGTQGTNIQARMFHGLFAPTATIGEVLDMEWIANGTVRFRCKTQPYPLAPRHAVAFRNFCDILVTNYPALLMPQNDQDMLQVLPAGSMDQWRLQPATTGYDLIRQPVAGASQLIGNVTTTRAATQAAKTYLQGAHARFARHPWLDAVAPLWRDDTEPPPKLYKTRAYAQAAKHGKNEVAGRATRMEQEDVKIVTALTTLTWRHITQLRGSTAHQRELMHRIKGQRVSGWNGTAGKRGCPHCPLLGTTGGDTTHIFWYCPRAQQRWTGLRAVWRGVGAWMHQSDDDDFLHAVFSLRLPRVPAAVWTNAAPTTTNQSDRACEIIALHATTQQAWQQHVLGTLSLLRRWRNSKIDPATSWNDAQAAYLHQGWLAAATRRLSMSQPHAAPSHRACQTLLSAIYSQRDAIPSFPPAPPEAHTRYILFFDGGSRGNPRPGGSGAVVVATNDTATATTIVWVSAMSLASTATTNNQAEYHGVVMGLQAALTHSWKPLEVVGDSLLILRQLQHYRPPRNERLRPLYAQARALADKLEVRDWLHHLREINKTADAVANVAMNTKTSLQTLFPSTRSEVQHLQPLLPGDFAHWQEAFIIRHEGFSL